MRDHKLKVIKRWMAVIVAAAVFALAGFAAGSTLNQTALAEATTVTTATSDPSPAIAVAQSTANSVVGVITNDETWDPMSRKTSTTMISQGSGVAIKEGGYVLTNYHVIEDGTSYQVLMPGGEKVDAELVGSDASTDIAVLKVAEEYADQLTPVSIGSSLDLLVGSTVIAIGNPGGEVLANTITQGVVSALERNVEAANTTRAIAYIQHDAAINSGNSGGGLFNYRGELVGINTLKYSGSAYSSVSFEGLGFAIPVETANEIAQQLIENGKVLRPAMGVLVVDIVDGPDEPMNNYPPKSVMIYSVNEGSPAEAAGLQQYDFIYEVNGVRVGSIYELTTEMDKHEPGDTIEVTVVRYNSVSMVQSSGSASIYGGYSSGATTPSVSGGYDLVTVSVTLEILE